MPAEGSSGDKTLIEGPHDVNCWMPTFPCSAASINGTGYPVLSTVLISFVVFVVDHDEDRRNDACTRPVYGMQESSG